VVADAVQLGRCTVRQLAEELRDGPMKGSAMFRSVLAEVADGIRSTAEGDLGELIRIARLPRPMFNPSLYAGDVFLGKPDAWWPDAGVAGEVDSRAWHLSPDDWDRTRQRHDRMAAAGIIVLHFSPREIRREPERVTQMIRGALDRGLARPSLLIRTIPCDQTNGPAQRGDKGKCRVYAGRGGAGPAFGTAGLAFGEGEGHFFYG
jgi:hypothetical protein